MSNKKTARQCVIFDQLDSTRKEVIRIQIDIRVYETLLGKVESEEIVFKGKAYSKQMIESLVEGLKDSEAAYLHKLNVLKCMRTEENTKSIIKHGHKAMSLAKENANTIKVDICEDKL